MGMDSNPDPSQVIFTITLYGDGTLAWNGKEPKEGNAGMADILRQIADIVEAGLVRWTDYRRP